MDAHSRLNSSLSRVLPIIGAAMLVGSPSSAPGDTVYIPPIIISGLNHQSDRSTPSPRPQVSDGVTFPSGPGEFTSEGFSAAIGTGDTIMARFEAPAGKQFTIRALKDATDVLLVINAFWQAGEDTPSAGERPIITFKNPRGTMPLDDYSLCSVCENGQIVIVNRQFRIVGDFSFEAVQVEFTVSSALTKKPRIYAPADSAAPVSFGALAYFAAPGGADEVVMSIDEVVTTGACCRTGACEIARLADCAGTFLGEGSACSPNPCPQPPTGACCAGTACSEATRDSCNAMFLGEGSACSPNPCPQPIGACCNGTACVITTADQCGGSFQQGVTTCGAPGNPTTCCPANFNGTDGLNVADIFDFLGAWFAGNPSADFNHVFGVSPMDIFDFFDAWFAGCK